MKHSSCHGTHSPLCRRRRGAMVGAWRGRSPRATRRRPAGAWSASWCACHGTLATRHTLTRTRQRRWRRRSSGLAAFSATARCTLHTAHWHDDGLHEPKADSREKGRGELRTLRNNLRMPHLRRHEPISVINPNTIIRLIIKIQ